MHRFHRWLPGILILGLLSFCGCRDGEGGGPGARGGIKVKLTAIAPQPPAPGVPVVVGAGQQMALECEVEAGRAPFVANFEVEGKRATVDIPGLGPKNKVPILVTFQNPGPVLFTVNVITTTPPAQVGRASIPIQVVAQPVPGGGPIVTGPQNTTVQRATASYAAPAPLPNPPAPAQPSDTANEEYQAEGT